MTRASAIIFGKIPHPKDGTLLRPVHGPFAEGFQARRFAPGQTGALTCFLFSWATCRPVYGLPADPSLLAITSFKSQ